ncbi:MAG: hypothetical protein OEU92_30080 [Alphaproteobacteria bacterium]|nr:hypothetical protein [Alphaproteobacteria bacterium]
MAGEWCRWHHHLSRIDAKTTGEIGAHQVVIAGGYTRVQERMHFARLPPASLGLIGWTFAAPSYFGRFGRLRPDHTGDELDRLSEAAVLHLLDEIKDVAVSAGADPSGLTFIPSPVVAAAVFGKRAIYVPAALEAGDAERTDNISFAAVQGLFDIGEFSGTLTAFARNRSRAPVAAGAFSFAHRTSSRRAVRR